MKTSFQKLKPSFNINPMNERQQASGWFLFLLLDQITCCDCTQQKLFPNMTFKAAGFGIKISERHKKSLLPFCLLFSSLSSFRNAINAPLPFLLL